MRVLYDHQIFTLQKFGGISRYYSELMSNLHQQKDIDVLFPLVYSNNEYLQEASFYANEHYLPLSKFPFKRMIVEKYNKRSFDRSCELIQQQNYDIFHPTYYDPYFLKVGIKKPFVVTIYDMTHEVYTDNFDMKDETTEQKKILAEKATRIIAISNHTKNDIIKYLGIPESKIDVVYLGNSLSYNAGMQIDNLPGKYILFVGNRSVYKNFTGFIKAVAPILNRDDELCVVAAGGKTFNKDENELFTSLGIISQVFHQPINKNDVLSAIYGQARAFVFPSFYEGFGIPVLEAFACNCPAIISHNSSLIEVGGDAVQFFDPNSDISMRNTIADVIYNEHRRIELIQKGTERLKLFSWNDMTQEILNIYRKLV